MKQFSSKIFVSALVLLCAVQTSDCSNRKNSCNGSRRKNFGHSLSKTGLAGTEQKASVPSLRRIVDTFLAKDGYTNLDELKRVASAALALNDKTRIIKVGTKFERLMQTDSKFQQKSIGKFFSVYAAAQQESVQKAAAATEKQKLFTRAQVRPQEPNHTHTRHATPPAATPNTVAQPQEEEDDGFVPGDVSVLQKSSDDLWNEKNEHKQEAVLENWDDEE